MILCNVGATSGFYADLERWQSRILDIYPHASVSIYYSAGVALVQDDRDVALFKFCLNPDPDFKIYVCIIS